jgi:NAD(P)H-hydrate epimerase
MKRIEKMAFEEGFSENQFMEIAGTRVGEYVHDFVEKNKIPKKVFLLVGKGNNGGDAYVAGTYLLQKGYTVEAFHLAELESSSPLNQFYCERFIESGGRVEFLKEIKNLSFPSTGLIVDGLLGTGFKGQLEGLYLDVIEMANDSCLPIVSIDIPSGVNGTTGIVETKAIFASMTVYLGMAKMGFFINDGWNHVGKLVYADFGLSEKFIELAKEEANLFTDENVTLPKLIRKRHKYQTGYVIGIAGSPKMGGAAKLSALASLRAGAGIIRLFYPENSISEMENAPLEIVKNPFSLEDFSSILQELKRAKACFIGPGLGREEHTKRFLYNFVPKIEVPTVFDADALYLIDNNSFPKNSILTPHHKEMMRLLKIESVKDDDELYDKCQAYAKKHQLVIVLKGAPSVIFHYENKPVIIAHGDPGMATAGTGDVLTGIIAAVLAQNVDSYQAALLGVFLHGVAGEWAAEKKSSYSLIASDLIDMLPLVFKQLQLQVGRIL